MWKQLKHWTIEQVMWAEKNLKGKNSAEKRKAVIEKLDDMIVLPSYLEWVDDIIIGKLVDMVCDKLNDFAGHDFTELELTEQQEQEIADEIPNPEAEDNDTPAI